MYYSRLLFSNNTKNSKCLTFKSFFFQFEADRDNNHDDSRTFIRELELGNLFNIAVHGVPWKPDVEETFWL